MANVHHDAPEVVPQCLPEVAQKPTPPPQLYSQQQYLNQSQYIQSPGTPQPGKSPDLGYHGGVAGGYGAYVQDQQTVYDSTLANDTASTYQPTTLPPPEKSRKTICGCGMLVFTLSVIIAVLSAAVVGLAAGTGVEAKRASSAESRADELSSSLAALETPTATATATNFDSITNNCSTEGTTVSGTTYTPQFFNKPTYKMYCNSDTPLGPLMSLFTADFDTCMDACASYTDALNETCAAVSFVPAWTNKTTAIEGTAPGNCYLKPGPQNTTALSDSTYIEVHAAILDA